MENKDLKITFTINPEDVRQLMDSHNLSFEEAINEYMDLIKLEVTRGLREAKELYYNETSN